MKIFWQRLWQILSSVLIKKRDYLKEIEETIEAFRLMSERKQREHFRVSSRSVENNLVEGDFDNKVHIKYLMRFIKVIKTRIFFPKTDDVNYMKLISAYTSVHAEIGRFINELYGIEKIKEDDFLNILNHEDRVNLTAILKSALVSFRVTINRRSSFNEHKKFATSRKSVFALQKDDIKKIINKTLQKIPEPGKIYKLKIFSEIFKRKAEEYRNNAKGFLMLAIMLIVFAFVFAFAQGISKFDIELPQKYNVDSNAFYIYLILESLFRGKLLFSVIALTGFFYCLRFYAASNHNAIICDQRANTLESFEALYENVEEDKERLLVVEKVVNSVTEHLPTGFSKQQSDSGVGGIVSSLLSLVGRSSGR